MPPGATLGGQFQLRAGHATNWGNDQLGEARAGPRAAVAPGLEEQPMSDTTINAEEVEKFGRMADEWWDPRGKFRPIHKFNPVRLGYIREHAVSHFGKEATAIRPFEGLSVLDIGCGGGLLSEPLTRLGAKVTGIDASGRNIGVARLHAENSGLEIDYRIATAEALAGEGGRFDIVLNMEVVEHVDNVPLYMKSCATLVMPGGLMFTATINRTARALALAIYGAEYVLRWLPRGTHDWHKFLTPEEIRAQLGRNGLKVIHETGVAFNPIRREWGLSRDMAVNYMVLASKPMA
jgi:2-polyprenyl-6-hydroxyphenyl methylase/3-demethylubiquinone-9 3-methyltransferase